MTWEPDNLDRAEWARAAFDAFAGQIGQPSAQDLIGEKDEEPFAEVVTDLLTDLFHLADLRGIVLEVEACAERARMHYDAETDEAREAGAESLRMETSDGIPVDPSGVVADRVSGEPMDLYGNPVYDVGALWGAATSTLGALVAHYGEPTSDLDEVRDGLDTACNAFDAARSSAGMDE